jgi:beta-lactamase superfamily II metal-dependent hydrolase
LADDKATVLRGVFHGLRVLLLADLGRAGQDALLARQPDLGADIVIAGLPSQGEPLADALLDNIAPRLIIIADSQFPAQARASSELVERLGRRPLPVFYTRQTGAITLSLRPGEWEIRTMAEQRIVGQGR